MGVASEPVVVPRLSNATMARIDVVVRVTAQIFEEAFVWALAAIPMSAVPASPAVGTASPVAASVAGDVSVGGE